MSLARARKAVLLRDRRICHYCGYGNGHTVDHKKPRHLGGPNNQKNLVACCLTCNREKLTMPYKLFKRFVRMYGRPEPGWLKTTNWYKAQQIRRFLNEHSLNKTRKILRRHKHRDKKHLLGRVLREVEYNARLAQRKSSRFTP